MIVIHKPAAVGTTLARLAAVSAALALTGCATKIDLPDITAREVFVSHQNPLFNVSINAENVVDHGDHVTAEKLTYERGGRITSTVIRVEGYRRDKTPAQAASAAPAQVATPPPSNDESNP